LVLATAVAGNQPARAQSATGPDGVEFTFTPYLWMLGTSVTTKTPFPRIPKVTSKLGFGQTLSHLNGLPIMGSGEIRAGSFGLLLDFMRAPLATDITTRNIYFSGGRANFNANVGSAVFVYRVLKDPVQFVDVGIGVRAWGFGMGLDLNPGLAPATSIRSGANWADPLIAGRYHRDLGDGFGFTAYGDVGGFDVGAHSDWTLIGTVDYVANSWLTLHAGYRAMGFNYSSGTTGFSFDTVMKGPLLAGTIRF
jgi:hypothetical protein